MNKQQNYTKPLQRDSLKQFLVFSEFTPDGAVLAEALIRDMVEVSAEPVTVVEIDQSLAPLLRDLLNIDQGVF